MSETGVPNGAVQAPPWWNDDWQAIVDGGQALDASQEPPSGLAPAASPSADQILALWPRLSGDDQDLVRRRVRADKVLVTGELFVCFAVSVPDQTWHANLYMANLFGPSWSRGLTMAADAVVLLVEDPQSLPGPWLEPAVEDQWSLIMESPLWEPMLTDVVHDAVASDRLVLDQARSLHRRTCRDPDCVILDLRPDTPWAIASHHLASPSAYLRRLAVEHPGCPLETRLVMLDDESPDVVRAAVTREATTEFDRAVLEHRRFVARRELARYPDRLLAVLDQTDAAGWERMAKWCAPGVSSRYVDRFMGHDSWRVRAAFVREHHDDERTAAQAGGDEHPRVRTALATVRPDVPGLADDSSHLVRRAVATHTSNPGVLGRLAHDHDERVRRVAAQRVVGLMAEA